MEGQVLNNTKCEKDLGVHIDDQLNFKKHISFIINKANRILAIVRRTFDYMDKETFLYIYKGLIRPQLEYASSVWAPHGHGHIQHIEDLERVQRRATKQVPGLKDLSYCQRLKALDLPTLAFRRTRGDMIQAYKILHPEIGFDKSLPEFLVKSTTCSEKGLRGHNQKLFKPTPGLRRSDLRKYSFSQRIIKLWNSLNRETVNANSVHAFERLLDKEWENQDLKFNNFKAEITIGNLARF